MALLPPRNRPRAAELEGGEDGDDDAPQSQDPRGRLASSPPSDEPAEMPELRAQLAALQATQEETMVLARRQHELLSDWGLFYVDEKDQEAF